MDDQKIVDLYWERSESAIKETQKKYGRYCHSIAYAILHSNEDAEECVNDTYLRAWGAIPPAKPSRLATFLGKITRNLALDRYDSARAQKRHAATELVLEELSECIPDADSTLDLTDKIAVITGAGGVLMSEFARALAASGAKVALLDINTEAAEAVAEDTAADTAEQD